MKNTEKELESQVLNDVCNYLAMHKIFFWRSNNIPVFAKNNGGKYAFRSLPKWTPKGIPDIIAVLDGVAVGIEVKRGGDRPGKLTPEQADFGLKMKFAGGAYFVARSVDDVRRNLLNVKTSSLPCCNCECCSDNGSGLIDKFWS